MEYGLVVQLSLLLMLLGVIAYFKAIQMVRSLREQGIGAVRHNNDTSSLVPDTQSLSTIRGAGLALTHPPSLEASLRQMQAVAPVDPYRLPLGWYAAPDGARVAFTTLVRGVNHLAITGQSDCGKDNAALVMLLALAALHPPEALQFCLIDGKGLDFAPFADKAHAWQLALRPAEIAPTMRALSREREARVDILRTAGVAKWDEYSGGDLPLLVVFVSELSLLQDAVGNRELESWLNSELATGRAFGIRYIVATQTLSNFGTRWRSQIGLYLAGYQPSTSQDQPNTGLTTAEIKLAGGVPPSELPAPSQAAGMFTAIEGRQVVTVRLPYLSTPERRRWLAKLPHRIGSSATHEQTFLEALPGATKNATSASERSARLLLAGSARIPADRRDDSQMVPEDESSGSVVAVTAAERAAILTARVELMAEASETGEPPSRRAICRRAFKGATGGAAYRKVQTILDELEREGPLNFRPTA